MSVETTVKIREYSSGEELPAVTNDFVRRSWTAIHRGNVSLTAGVTTELETNLTSYEYVYFNITGTATTVTVYVNDYPEIFGVGFDDTFHVWGMTGVTKLRLKPVADTTVSAYLAGS